MTTSVEDDIRAAMTGAQDDNTDDNVDEVTQTPETVQNPDQAEGQEAEGANKTTATPDANSDSADQSTATTDTTPQAVVEAPVALSGAIKAKWNTLPEDVQREWKKREDDIHRMMTSHDGELRVGREMKEAIAPYMATIQAEGGTPVGAVKDLLNTAYILRTGSPHQKAAVLMQAAQQFGVDLSLHQQTQQNPQLVNLHNEIHQLRQNASPEAIERQLQERMEAVRIDNEIRDFAANPKNVHFETVRADMGALMTSGRAKDLQEAYEMACWANPSIRQANLSAQEEAAKAKRKAEMDAKRKASASVVGSPAGTAPTTNATTKSLEDEIRDNLRAAQGEII